MACMPFPTLNISDVPLTLQGFQTEIKVILGATVHIVIWVILQ